MSQQPDSDLQAELVALRQKIGDLEAKQRDALRSASRSRRPVFSRPFLFGVLPVVLLLTVGGLLYGQGGGDALFITPEGRVGIGTNAPKAQLDVQGMLHTTGNLLFSQDDQTTDAVGIYWKTPPTSDYAIHRTEGKWEGQNFQQLRLGWLTGIILDPGWQFTKSYVEIKGNGLRVTEGNVRIGNPDPSQAKLGVAGNVFIQDSLQIGNPDPSQAKLDVAGNVFIRDFLQIGNSSKVVAGIPNGRIVFPGEGVAHAQIRWVPESTYVGRFEFIDSSDGHASAPVTGTPPRFVNIKAHKLTVDQLDVTWINQAKLRNSEQSDQCWNEGKTCAAVLDYRNLPSDIRLKTDTHPIPTALAKIRNLRGATYHWNQTALDYFTSDIEKTISAGPNATAEENRKLWQAERDKRYKELSRTNVGVIAQEVEAVLPEAVTTDEETGYKSVRYHYLIPLLIEALKEQDTLVAQQQADIERLTVAQQTLQHQVDELAALKAQMARLEAAVHRATAIRATSLR